MRKLIVFCIIAGLIFFAGCGGEKAEPEQSRLLEDTWSGSGWGTVVLKKTGDTSYEGTYTDTYGRAEGRLRLIFTGLTGSGNWWEGEGRGGKIYDIQLSEDGRIITGKWNTTKYDFGVYVEEATLTWKRR